MTHGVYSIANVYCSTLHRYVSLSIGFTRMSFSLDRLLCQVEWHARPDPSVCQSTIARRRELSSVCQTEEVGGKRGDRERLC